MHLVKSLKFAKFYFMYYLNWHFENMPSKGPSVNSVFTKYRKHFFGCNTLWITNFQRTFGKYIGPSKMYHLQTVISSSMPKIGQKFILILKSCWSYLKLLQNTYVAKIHRFFIELSWNWYLSCKYKLCGI